MNDGLTTYRRSRTAVIVVADLAALTEIVLAMRQAVAAQADLTSAFVSSFFTMFLPTVALVAAGLILLRLRYGKAIRAAARDAVPVADEGGLVV